MSCYGEEHSKALNHQNGIDITFGACTHTYTHAQSVRHAPFQKNDYTITAK